MNILAIVFCSISIALTTITAPVLLWQFIVGVFGLFPMKKKKETGGEPAAKSLNKFHRFAVVICARNEQAVIGCLIDSLTAQDYPRGQFDIFVAADNCTDGTAEEARRRGAIVYERFDTQHVGKGYALRWLLNRIEADYPSAYDAVTVFDADNLADPAFLRETNKALCDGADMVKGLRRTKNLGDSWVSDCYAIYWLSMMRFFHIARANCGLSCFVDGTGFSFKTELIRGEGWNTFTMVEDCEFSMQQICREHRIVPVSSAVFYDEQPATFALSLRQRFRWTVGCVQCIPYCLPAALQMLGIKSSDKKRNRLAKWEALDVIDYLLFIPAVALNLIAGLCGFIALMIGHPSIFPAGYYYSFSVLSFVLSWLSVSAGALLTLLLEKYPLRSLLRAVALFPVFIFSMAYMAVIAVLRPKAAWKPITHSCQTSITDLADKP